MQHAVETADDAFIIVHVETMDIFNGVIVIKRNDNILKKYDWTLWSANGRLSTPMRLIVVYKLQQFIETFKKESNSCMWNWKLF